MPWYDNYTRVVNLAKIKEQLNDGSSRLDIQSFSTNHQWSGTVTFADATPVVGNYVKLVSDAGTFAEGFISDDSSANFYLNTNLLVIADTVLTGYITQGVVSRDFSVELYGANGDKANWIRLQTAGTYNEKNTAINVPLTQTKNLYNRTITADGAYTINVDDLIGQNDVALGSHATIKFTVTASGSGVQTLTDEAVRPNSSGIVSLSDIASHYGKSGVTGTIDIQNWAGNATYSLSLGSIAWDSTSQKYLIDVDADVTTTTTSGQQGFYNGDTYNLSGQTIGLDKAVVGTTGTASGNNYTFAVSAAGYLEQNDIALTLTKATIDTTPTVDVVNHIATFSTTANGAGYLGNSTAALQLNCYTGAFEN